MDMLVLVAGLVLFLGVHSVRVFAEGWRTDKLQRLGEKRWKAAFSVVAVIGFVLVVWGYALARQHPVVLWNPPPVGLRHAASLLTLVAFVLVVAAYVPGNIIKTRLRHPMILGVKVWAFSHLIVNNTLADVVLFGSFLAWAVLDYASARRRTRTLASVDTPAAGSRIILTLVLGVLLWAVFAFWLHEAWIGVRPMAA